VAFAVGADEFKTEINQRVAILHCPIDAATNDSSVSSTGWSAALLSSSRTIKACTIDFNRRQFVLE
jgi:hypothetical protein